MSGKRKVGRPSKYEKVDLAQVEKLAGYGFTDVEIADILDISKATLNVYKNKPEFLDSLKRGKVKADSRVVRSLFERATGYDHEDIHFSAYEGDVTQTPYIKHIAPDVTAQIFWLKNRRRQDWRDRDSDDGGNRRDELAKVMAAYAKAFMDHPGQGVATQGDPSLSDESSEIQDDTRGEAELQE